MRVEFGNDAAKVAYRDPNSDQPELVRYRPLEGQQVTTMIIPDGKSLADAFRIAVETLKLHMVEGGKPKWVEGDNIDLVTMLRTYYGVSKARPKNWGKK